jgi:hypothetical protein
LILILQVNKEFWEEIMRIKLLVVLCLSAFLFLAGCRSNSNTNTNLVVATPTPVVKTTEAATVDPNLKGKIESALKAKGFNDVTVDTSTTPMTISGTVAKGKLDQVMAAGKQRRQTGY